MSRLDETGEASQQGRFAGPVTGHDRKAIALTDDEVEVLKQRGLREESEVAEADGGHVHLWRAARRPKGRPARNANVDRHAAIRWDSGAVSRSELTRQEEGRRESVRSGWTSGS